MHTPRSSFDLQLDPAEPATGFFDLPAELRVRIYKLAFSNAVSCSISIEKYRSVGWRCHVQHGCNAMVPSLLLVSKRLHEECVSVLYDTCAPRITVEHNISYHHDRSSLNSPCSWLEKRDCQDVRDIQSIKPILHRVANLRIQVVVTESHLEQAITVALLRWMRAVLRSRPVEVHLRSVELVFFASNANLKPIPGHGLLEVLRGVGGADVLDAWFVVLKGRWNHPGPEEWENICLAKTVSTGYRGEADEKMAWQAFRTAARRLPDLPQCRYSRLRFFCSTISGR